MRMIDADALKEALCISELKEMNIAVSGAILERLIDCVPTVGGWISVEDMLPETDDEVLTTYIVNGNKTKRFVETASYFDDGDGEGHWSSVWDEYRVSDTLTEVIAWMPMPKPYKPPKEG